MNSFGAADAAPAAQVLIAIIPIVGIVMGAVVVFFWLLWRHREVVRQINAGSYSRPVFNLPVFSLLDGHWMCVVAAFLRYRRRKLYIAWRTDSFCDGTESACVLLRDPK